MDKDVLLKRIKSCLQNAYGSRLKGVVLYGSSARGDAAPDSDIDLLVLLKAPIRLAQDVHTCTRAVYPLILETGRIIDAAPVDVRNYEMGEAPLYADARKEGTLV